MTRGERRDFVLDSGAVSALANDDRLFDAYRKVLQLSAGGSLHIPSAVMCEVHTGHAKYDALVNLMVNRIRRPNAEVYILNDHDTNMRAGELRFEAEKALDAANGGKPRKPGDEVTGIDALVVAIAERLSRLCPVTILTTDLRHIQALVHATGSPNIEVNLPR